MNGALLSSCYIVSLLCLLFQMLWCVFERGGYPSIYTGGRQCSEAILGAYPASTALACFHATTTARRGREAPRGEQLPPRSGRPLTIASSHRLCVVGRGLDQDGFPVVLCPICIDVIGVSLVPLRKSALGSVFRWIISCICVYDLQNMLAPKLEEGC
jgi:hypothetical protein